MENIVPKIMKLAKLYSSLPKGFRREKETAAGSTLGKTAEGILC
jgi:hypothetical protein